jgi:hypothetical protein
VWSQEGEKVLEYTCCIQICYIQIYWQTCILQLLDGAPQVLDLVFELADELEELERT